MLLLMITTAQATSVCYVGYIMDSYCINRGRLLDKPSLETLQNPEQHSVHCLVDVGLCTSSGFEVLSETANSEGLHCRAYQMDQAGTNMAITLGRAIGVCSTCTGAGNQSMGFKATGVDSAY